MTTPTFLKPPKISKTASGVLLKLLAVALFSPVFITAKFVTEFLGETHPALALMAMRYIGGFITMLIFVVISRTPANNLRTNETTNHALRACMGIGGGAFIMHATNLLPVANATAIGLTEGILVIVLASLILKETITPRHWLAAAIGLFGTMLVISQSIDLSALSLSKSNGIISAILGAIFIAGEALMIKHLSGRESPLRMLLYVNGFGALIAPILVAIIYGPQTLTPPGICLFLGLGPLAIISQYFNILANIRANASTLAPMTYTWIIFASTIGFLVFDEIPTLLTFIGSGFIIAGGIIVARAQK